MEPFNSYAGMWRNFQEMYCREEIGKRAELFNLQIIMSKWSSNLTNRQGRHSEEATNNL